MFKNHCSLNSHIDYEIKLENGSLSLNRKQLLTNFRILAYG